MSLPNNAPLHCTNPLLLAQCALVVNQRVRNTEFCGKSKIRAVHNSTTCCYLETGEVIGIFLTEETVHFVVQRRRRTSVEALTTTLERAPASPPIPYVTTRSHLNVSGFNQA